MKKIIFTIPLLFCFFFSQANMNSFGPDSICSVTIDTIQNGFCLQANPTGTAPFTYQWNDNTFNNYTCMNAMMSEYCVTVTDATGCEAIACVSGTTSTCNVWIEVDSLPNSIFPILNAYSSGPAGYSYLWSNGDTGSSLSISADGTYCVTVTDSNGCANSECVTIIVNTGSNCYVNMIESDSCVTAVPTGTAPFTYLWNDGSTSNELCASSSIGSGDTLCVTVTDANGCVSTGCGIIWSNNTNCSVWISETATGLAANASGSPNSTYTYSWSTGETTPSITTTLTGNYCVTITTDSGCQAIDCDSVQADDEISGYLYLDSLGTIGGNNGVNTFMVYLIEHDASVGTLTAIDSLVLTTTPNNFGGYYSFTNVGDGDYLVKAAIQPGSDQYDNYLPTYYGDVLYWDDATTIVVPGNNAFRNIWMTVGVNPGGPGFIGGLISEGANIVSGQVEVRDEGDPIANVSILILTDSGEPISHTVTDTDGQFSFPNLAYGTYEVVVEILGKEQGSKMVTIGADDPSEMINFGVNEESGTITNVEDLLNSETLRIFPNPVSDVMNIQVDIKENTQLNISVINLLGKTMVTENIQLSQGTQMMNISLKNLPTGVYFLNLSDGQSIISKKIMKN